MELSGDNTVQKEKNNNRLGDAIYKAREAKGISTPKLAAAIGMNDSGVRRIQLGETRQPRPAVLAKIAEALDLDKSELFALAGYTTADELPDLNG